MVKFPPSLLKVIGRNQDEWASYWSFSLFAEAHHCGDNSVMVLFCCRAAIAAER